MARPSAFQRLRADALQHYEHCAERLRQLKTFYFEVATMEPPEDSETTEGADVSLFGFVSDLQMSLQDLYIPSVDGLLQVSDGRPVDLPIAFISSLIDHLLSFGGDDLSVYPLSFEELTIWLIKDFASSFLFPFRHSVTGMMELHALSSRYERPTFAFLHRCVRRALLYFFSLVDGSDQVLFSNYNKVDLRIFRPTDGLFTRMSGGTVSRCQTLLRGFTLSRPIRKVGDLARPA